MTRIEASGLSTFAELVEPAPIVLRRAAPAFAAHPIALRRIQNRLDPITRPVAYLLIDAADIFAQQADAEQHDADQEEVEGEQREQALDLRAQQETAHQQHHEQHAGQQGQRRADHREPLQRHDREAGDQVEVQAHQLVQRIFRFARVAFLVADLDLDRIRRERVGQRGDEGIDLAAGIDGIDHAAVVGAQHAPLVGHPDMRDPLAQPVHRERGDSPKRAVMALAADRADIVVAGADRFDQPRDFLGRILQVRVERDHHAAARMLKAGQDRHVLAEIAVEHHHARDLGPLAELPRQDLGRAVGAAVVDEDDLVAGAQAVERRIEPVEQRLQAGLLVVDGDHHRHLDRPGARRRGPAWQRRGLVVANAGGLTRQRMRHRAGHQLGSYGSRRLHVSFSVAQTRSTSASCMAGKSGSVRMPRPTRSACGSMPSRQPSER